MKNENSRGIIVGLISVFFVVTLSGIAFGQKAEIANYPTKPIKLIVAFAPGGTTDISARALAKAAEKYLGQPIVVVNQPGGGGSKGPTLLAKEKPDGYSIGTLSGGAACWAPLVIKLSYDPLKDFTPLLQYGEYISLVAARTDAPFKTAKELLEYSRRNPGLTFAVSGIKQVHDTIQLMVAKKAGITWRPVAYDGGVPAVTALLGGHVSFVAMTQELVPYIRSGDLRPLVSYMNRRSKLFPDVPTWRELGFDVGNEGGLGIAGPAGMPQPVVHKLVDAFKKAMEDREFIEIMEKMYIPIFYNGPEEFTKFIETNLKATAQMFKELGVQTVN